MVCVGMVFSKNISIYHLTNHLKVNTFTFLPPPEERLATTLSLATLLEA